MRINNEKVQELSDRWASTKTTSLGRIKEANWFEDQLNGISCTVVMPLGELTNPAIGGFVKIWEMKGLIIPEPIGPQHSLNADKEEGCYRIPMMLSTAIRIWREVAPDRINIFTPVKLSELPEGTYHI